MKNLSKRQLSALLSFAAQNGRNWKSELRQAWMTGAYNGTEDAGALQTIRNEFGPSWLVRCSLAKLAA